MVKICNTKYTNNTYDSYFEWYPFPLSDFQKYAIEGLIEDKDVLITAHTGSGKTLPAEFAIQYFHGKGKKVIYTSPIKALSNQKFSEFTNKFPNVSVGILTGDIKFNPEADVLIMTTEILQNTLYQMQKVNPQHGTLHFQMNLEDELGCVIFDEIHYINDADRGKVWEESIMMLPEPVQMLMLSATINRPEKFASWIENRYKTREVVLAPTNHRVVPLTHYCYVDTNSSLYKHETDKEKQTQLKSVFGNFHIIKQQNEPFDDGTYLKVTKTLKSLQEHKIHVKPIHVLNSLVKKLKESNMLPALCFVFSRKNVEKYAKQLNVSLFEEDEIIPSIIQKECDNVLRKLPNYEEYVTLPEYVDTVKLLEKGIAIHHSGVMPILREMVEILFGKGYIRVLFATETFAVGINMPTKTVVFTSLSKYTNGGNRQLLGHEYTQMAGRAGRRGLDTKGYVIHLNNLFWNNYPTMTEYKHILKGDPQVLVSKFQIHYNLILNLVSIGNMDFDKFIANTMLHEEIEKDITARKQIIENMNNQINDTSEDTTSSGISQRTTVEEIQEYLNLEEELPYLKNKKQKQAKQRINDIKVANKHLDRDLQNYKEKMTKKMDLCREMHDLENSENYVKNNIQQIINILKFHDYIEEDDEKYTLTHHGVIASQVREITGLLIAPLIHDGTLDQLTTEELVGYFSVYISVNVSDEMKTHNIQAKYSKIQMCVTRTKDILHKFQDDELRVNMVSQHTDMELQYDFMDYIVQWCLAHSEGECKFIYQKIQQEKDIFLGEFVKAIMKINNIANELLDVCEKFGYISLMHKLSKISEMTLKHIATNQSLYV
jgi:superfamily II RNA helicase